MCEMTAVDWYPNARKLDHLRYLEIIKPVDQEKLSY